MTPLSQAVTALGMALLLQNSSQFRDWKDTALADRPQVTPKAACAALVAQTGYDFSILSAVSVPAAGDTPSYCRVVGLIQPEIRFEVNLPSPWNGRLYMFGNGGYAGEAIDNPGRQAMAKRALARGFATAQSNTGHDAAAEPLAAFASTPQKLVDYAFRAVHVTNFTARALLQAYYAAPARRAYFDGCSTGGRQGLIAAQRFPDDFDGIVVGAPVLNFSATMIAYAKDQKALAAAPLSADAIKTVGNAVLAKCDALDGVKDGVIDDPRRCPFTPATDIPTCSAAAAPGCLTAAQLHSVETIYSAVQRNGSTFFPGWPVGAESGWTPWFVAANGRAIAWNFGEAFLKNIAFGRPNPAYDWLTFDVNADLDKIQGARSLVDATNPDLSRFKARGGRIVSYVGWADPALNPLMSVGYYEDVLKTMGAAATQDFYRMFMVPGIAHCGGGAGTSTFDAFTPLVQWVEKGAAPDTIPASRVVDGNVVRTRPLCPYPQTAIYKGTGSTDDAANFSCGTR